MHLSVRILGAGYFWARNQGGNFMNIKYLSLGLGLAVCLSFIPVMAQNNSFNDNIMKESARQALAKSELKNEFKSCITAAIGGLKEITKMKENGASLEQIERSGSLGLVVDSLRTIYYECFNIWLDIDYFSGDRRVSEALWENKIDTITNADDIIFYIFCAFRCEHWTGTPVSEIILNAADDYLVALTRLNELIEQW